MKHRVFKFIILTIFSTISSQQHPDTTRITESYAKTTRNPLTITESTTARKSLIRLKRSSKRLSKIESFIQQCDCECKTESVAECVSRKYICEQEVCVKKCQKKRCKKSIQVSPKIKITHHLPSNEIRCGIKNDEHLTDEHGDILENKYNNIFNPNKSPGSKISNGKTAEIGEWPWQVSLRKKPRFASQLSQHFCGAVIIDSKTVLTAAHCLWNCNNKIECQNGKGSFIPDRFIVALGFHKSSVTAEEKDRIIVRDKKFGTQIQQIDTREGKLKGKVIVHPDYKGENYYTDFWLAKSKKSGWMQNDIAIIKLQTTLKFKARTNIRPICLPKPDGDIKPEINNKVFISGYGETESGEPAKQLRWSETNLISNEECTSQLSNYYKLNDRISYHITASQLCALSKNVDTCRGDSGGALAMPVTFGMTEQTERYQLEGVTGWGFGCGLGIPGIYTKVSHFMEFILKHSKYVQTVEDEMMSI